MSFNFGSSTPAPAAGGGGFAFGAPATPAAPGATTNGNGGGFAFGGSTAPAAAPAAAAGGGFSFGGAAAPAAAPAAAAGGGFSFGGGAAKPAAPAAAAGGGFSFGGAPAKPVAPTAPAAAAGGFAFGGATAKPTAPAAPAVTGGFGFGGAAAKPAAPAAPAAAAGGFGFGGGAAKTTAPATAAPAAGGFSFGGAPATPAAAETKVAFGAAPAAAPVFGNAPAAATAAAPAAPAAGGFSFGGAAPAKSSGDAATAKVSFGSTNAAPAVTAVAATADSSATTGGFSFKSGAPSLAPPKTDDATPASAPNPDGFSFGGPTQKKDATPTAKTPADPAPDTAGGFNFNTPALAPTPAINAKTTTIIPSTSDKTDPKTTTPNPTTPSTNLQINPPPAEAYQTKTIEEILNSFTSHLESDASLFLQEAKRVAEYDTILRHSQSSITKLSSEVSKFLIHQQDLDGTLRSVTAFHSEIEGTLDSLEKDLDEIFENFQGISPEDADMEREKALQRAFDVDTALENVNQVLEGTVGGLNQSLERARGSGGTRPEGEEDVGQIVNILNAHYETLAWLEGSGKSLEEDVAVIGRVLSEQ